MLRLDEDVPAAIRDDANVIHLMTCLAADLLHRSRPRSGVNKKTGVGSLQDRQVIEGKDLRPCHTEYPLPSASAATSTSCSLRTRDFRRSWRTSPGSAHSC